MKLKVVVVDLELTRTQKRFGAGGLALAVALVCGAALADVPKTFAAGEVLKAADLNANLGDLDARLTAAETAASEAEERLSSLETAPAYLVSTSNVAQTGTLGVDVVYNSMEVVLQPGTWLVEAHATLFTSGNSDVTQLGLWDETAGADVPSSRGAGGTSAALDGGNYCGAQYCLGTPGFASAVITVTAPTTIRAKAFRNGGSTLTVGPPNSGVVLSPLNRISALRLR